MRLALAHNGDLTTLLSDQNDRAEKRVEVNVRDDNGNTALMAGSSPGRHPLRAGDGTGDIRLLSPPHRKINK